MGRTRKNQGRGTSSVLVMFRIHFNSSQLRHPMNCSLVKLCPVYKGTSAFKGRFVRPFLVIDKFVDFKYLRMMIVLHQIV